MEKKKQNRNTREAHKQIPTNSTKKAAPYEHRAFFFTFASTRVTAKVRSSKGGILHTNQGANVNPLHLTKQYIRSHISTP